MPKTPSKEHILSPEDMARLRNACQDQEELILVDILSEAGLRISELAHLRFSWLEQDDCISVPERQSCDCGECVRLRKGFWRPKTKSGARSIPLPPSLAKELRTYLAHHKNGFGLSRISLWARLHKVAKRVKLIVFPHSLRATYATRLAEQHISAATLQYVMGWSSIKSADAYIRSSKARAQQELGQIWKNPS